LDCVKRRARQQEDALTAVFSARMSYLEASPELAAMQKAQTAWVQFRDANCAYIQSIARPSYADEAFSKLPIENHDLPESTFALVGRRFGRTSIKHKTSTRSGHPCFVIVPSDNGSPFLAGVPLPKKMPDAPSIHIHMLKRSLLRKRCLSPILQRAA
jgi:hypothetical protein